MPLCSFCLGDKESNPAFTETQLMRALEKSASKAAGVTRSISPKYYDNCIGYAPRTVRLFSLASKAPTNQDYD